MSDFKQFTQLYYFESELSFRPILQFITTLSNDVFKSEVLLSWYDDAWEQISKQSLEDV
jgi:hypothetical protein